MNVYSIEIRKIKASNSFVNIAVPRTRQELGINKLVQKMPMSRKVLDDKNDLYQYVFEDGLKFLFIGSVSYNKT